MLVMEHSGVFGGGVSVGDGGVGGGGGGGVGGVGVVLVVVMDGGCDPISGCKAKFPGIPSIACSRAGEE